MSIPNASVYQQRSNNVCKDVTETYAYVSILHPALGALTGVRDNIQISASYVTWISDTGIDINALY